MENLVNCLKDKSAMDMLGFTFAFGKFNPHYIFKGITRPEVQCKYLVHEFYHDCYGSNLGTSTLRLLLLIKTCPIQN